VPVIKDVDHRQSDMRGSNGFVQLQSLRGIRSRFGEHFAGGTYPEKSEIKISAREVSVSSGITKVELNCTREESDTPLQVLRSHFVPEEVSLQASLVGLRMYLARIPQVSMFRVH